MLMVDVTRVLSIVLYLGGEVEAEVANLPHRELHHERDLRGHTDLHLR